VNQKKQTKGKKREKIFKAILNSFTNKYSVVDIDATISIKVIREGKRERESETTLTFGITFWPWFMIHKISHPFFCIFGISIFCSFLNIKIIK
jgi:hypothetical protein